jgi:hypothetical protein
LRATHIARHRISHQGAAAARAGAAAAMPAHLGQRVAHDVEQADDVGAAAQVLQDLDLALDLLLLHRLQDLDAAPRPVDDVDAVKDLRGSGGRGSDGMAARTRNAFGARQARRARTHARSAAALTSLYLPRPILRMTS